MSWAENPVEVLSPSASLSAWLCLRFGSFLCTRLALKEFWTNVCRLHSQPHDTSLSGPVACSPSTCSDPEKALFLRVFPFQKTVGSV